MEHCLNKFGAAGTNSVLPEQNAALPEQTWCCLNKCGSA
jgi:hypothetical protein